ncbi:POK19 protein, partial [Spizella passerina]|nr:POK19 protein [Spizella passerina]
MVVQNTLPSIFKQAKISHQFFHQNVPALVGMFKITRDQARSIIVTCPDCQSYALPSVGAGVNPREFQSLQLWQTEVT